MFRRAVPSGSRGKMRSTKRRSSFESSACTWNALLVQAAAHVVGGRNVQLPKGLRFPGGKGFRIDSANVGVSEQAQQFQTFRRADCFGKCADGLGIKDIPAHQVGGHGQMIADQEADRIGLLPRRRATGARGPANSMAYACCRRSRDRRKACPCRTSWKSKDRNSNSGCSRSEKISLKGRSQAAAGWRRR